jgi:hypothetical protein
MVPVLEETIYLDFIVSSGTGPATDADALPTSEVCENGTDTAIVTPTVVKRSGKTGNYYVPVACTAANGFEAGKSYNVVVTATVGGVAGCKEVVGRFQMRAHSEDNVNVSSVDPTLTYDGTAQGGGPMYITLSSSSSSVDGYYDGLSVTLVAGKGAGQSRNIPVGASPSYSGTSMQAPVDVAWATGQTPDNTSKYSLGPCVPASTIAKSTTDRFATIYSAAADVPGHDARLTVTGTATGTPTQTSVTLTMDVALNAAVLAAHFVGVGVTWNPGTRNGTGRYLPIASAVVNSTTSLTLTFASPGWPVAPAAGEGASISG